MSEPRSEPDLANLKTRRKQVFSQLQRFTDFLNNITSTDDTKCNEISFRVSKIEQTYLDFQVIQDQIEIIEDLESTVERQEFEDKYFAALSKASLLDPQYPKNDFINPNTVGHATNMQFAPEASHKGLPQVNIKLPQLSLPEFNGSYDNWSSFRDLFSSIIDQNTALNGTQKLYYLQAALKGEAAQIIQSLEITEANYLIAWDLLKKRYENKKIIIKTHLKNIFDLDTVHRDNFTSLRSFLDNFQKNYRALENLGEPVRHWNAMLIYLLVSKLDVNSKREWEIRSNDEISPTLQFFIDFITDRCKLLESLDYKGTNKDIPRKNLQSHLVTHNENCLYCNGNHKLFQCKDFLALSVDRRIQEVRRCEACVNCLRKGHKPSECLFGGCQVCGKRHNTLLHLNNQRTNTPPSRNSNNRLQNNQNQNIRNNNTISGMVKATFKNDVFVPLATAQIYIFDNLNRPILCRALLDNGSQSCFMTSNLYKRLGLGCKSIDAPVSGISAMSTNITKITRTEFKSKICNFKQTASFLIIDRITDNIPQIRLNKNKIDIPPNIQLADEQFYEPNCVDILLGANIFYELLLDGQIRTSTPGIVFQNSSLGYLISGELPLSLVSYNKPNSVRCHLVQTDIRAQLEKFWTVEETPGKIIKYSKEEQEVENHFVENVTRNEDGRFIVRLPVKENYHLLRNNIDTATKRFFTLERKFMSDKKLQSEYSRFMSEYIELGHATCLDEQLDTSDLIEKIYYLPHHAVRKETSQTTKLRVVFDASAKCESGLSLNDILKVGPCIQRDLFTILLVFRKYNVAFTADIAKMYRQILVSDDDKHLQRIVWRSDSISELKHFVLNTVTYGTSPASFLATRCLKELAIENRLQYPEASNAIEQNFYMDDFVCGANNIDEAISLIKQVDNILKSAGFELRQWNSNHSEIIDAVAEHNLNTSFAIKDCNISSRTLGLLWDTNTDCFQVTTKLDKQQSFTKREILSVIAQIFDPLGLIGPVVLAAKIILQLLWKDKSEWDKPISEEIKIRWLQFYNNLDALLNLKISRLIILPNAVKIEFHCFCDASTLAYGACIYLRSIDNYGNKAVHLVASKSRVAPLKTITIPRLELCAAVLSSKLFENVKRAMDISISGVFYWCDSTIVLAWIRSDPSKFKTFVSNRIAKIQSISNTDDWRHIPTSLNPGDLISRGVNPNEIEDLSLWWHGPSFLQFSSEYWPCEDNYQNNDNIPEIKQTTLVSLSALEHLEDDILKRFSSFNKLVHVIAYIRRFILNCKVEFQERLSGELSMSELDDSTKTIVKIMQIQEFKSELQSLKSSKHVSKHSKLYNLNPFLDSFGIIRVGGRLSKSTLSYDSKHPMIIPSKHYVTSLIILKYHYQNLHAGCQGVLSNIRSKFWIINGRQTVKGILRRCIICFRVKPKYMHQFMGDLPATRVNPARPFSIVGTDFAGPFQIKASKLRNRKLVKTYVCIFICFVTKAVHVELASDLSTDSFLLVFKRFIARRGLPARVYSDNATNYVGADRYLKQEFSSFVKHSKFKAFLNDHTIDWSFIPPRSPHFGGLWESAVRSVKHHTKRIFQISNLTFEEFYTCLTQIEAILNSRPLYPLTDDIEDLEALTPGHFLIGTSLNALPESEVPDIKASRASRYKHLRLLLQQFWKQWSKDYLHQLQQRTKWQTSGVPSERLGSLVLLHEDGVPVMSWRLGRISGVHPGSDNVVRVVSVKTAHGEVKRAVNRISILPIDS